MGRGWIFIFIQNILVHVGSYGMDSHYVGRGWSWDLLIHNTRVKVDLRLYLFTILWVEVELWGRVIHCTWVDLES